jgi:hypothetical protein
LTLVRVRSQGCQFLPQAALLPVLRRRGQSDDREFVPAAWLVGTADRIRCANPSRHDQACRANLGKTCGSKAHRKTEGAGRNPDCRTGCDCGQADDRNSGCRTGCDCGQRRNAGCRTGCQFGAEPCNRSSRRSAIKQAISAQSGRCYRPQWTPPRRHYRRAPCAGEVAYMHEGTPGQWMKSRDLASFRRTIARRIAIRWRRQSLRMRLSTRQCVGRLRSSAGQAAVVGRDYSSNFRGALAFNVVGVGAT